MKTDQLAFNLPDASGHIRVTYRRMRDAADRVSRMIHDRAREACREAGLDPNLLGIHPHNAMCAYHAGKPWPEVNYSKVRLTQRLERLAWEPSRIVDQWYRRIPSDQVMRVFQDS
jgi:hypothetical protein